MNRCGSAFILAVVTVLSVFTFLINAFAGEAGAPDGDITGLISDYPVGDADLNGIVDAADARLLLRAAVGLEKLTDLQRLVGDLDKNGSITAMDARGALRISVGLSAFDTPENQDTLAEQKAKSFAKAVNADLLYQNLDALTDCPGRYMGSLQAENAFAYIKKQLLSYGYSEASLLYQEVILNSARTGKNIVIKLPSQDKNAGILVISAHYDAAAVGRGSVDNGSGVCSLLEIARILKESKENYSREIHICFFTGEENGYLGAYRYLSAISEQEKSRIEQVFNLDMTAHFSSTKENYLCVSTEPSETSAYPYRAAKDNSGSLAIKKVHSLLGGCGETQFYAPVSSGLHDIIPFRKQEISSLTLSWREKKAGSGGDYDLIAPEKIHTGDDMMKNTDMQSLTLTTRLAAGSVAWFLYTYKVFDCF